MTKNEYELFDILRESDNTEEIAGGGNKTMEYYFIYYEILYELSYQYHY